MGGSSDMSMSSLHAEEGICKKLISQGISLKNGTLYCIRWTYNKETDLYTLCKCVPCEDCYKYLSKKGVNNVVISNDDPDNPLIKVDLNYIGQNTKKSTGRLYGN